MAKTYWFKVNPAGDVYEFNSEGLQGTIHKMVRFEEIAPGVYNAALGDVRENGEIDFEINTNNGDSSSILVKCTRPLRFILPVLMTGGTQHINGG